MTNIVERVDKRERMLDTIFIDKFEYYFAIRQKCPVCIDETYLTDVELDTMDDQDGNKYLMYIARCHDSIVAIEPKEESRIYVTGYNAITSQEIDTIINKFSELESEVNSITKKGDLIAWKDFRYFGVDWKDAIFAIRELLYQYETEQPIEFVVDGVNLDDEQLHVIGIYTNLDTELILPYVKPEYHSKFDGLKIKKIVVDPDSSKITIIAKQKK